MSIIDNDHGDLKRAFSLHQTGDLNAAAGLYRKLIARNPNNTYALHFLGLIEANIGDFGHAKILLERSLSEPSPNLEFLENYATILCQRGEYQTALQICRRGFQLNAGSPQLLYVSAISLFKSNKLAESLAQFDKLLSLQPRHMIALNERGSVLAAMKRYDAALASIEQSLNCDPNYAEALLNKGNIHGKLGRSDEAIATYDKALSLNPALADARIGRANIFRTVKRFDEAVADYETALKLNPSLAGAWLGRGNVSYDQKRYDAALAAYDKALALKPDLTEAWLGRGNVLQHLQHGIDALSAYDKALELQPDFADAWCGRGDALCNLKRYDDALKAFDRAIELRPNYAEAWLGRGKALFEIHELHEALAAFDKALSIKPNFSEAISNRIFVLDFKSDAGFEEQQKARKYWWQQVGSAIAERSRMHHLNTRDPDRKIKVGYASADFRVHSAARCIGPMLFNRDKSRFEITCYSSSLIEDELTKDFQHAADRWRNVAQSSDDELCEQIQADQIDILVDLSGHTAGHRLGAFARKPAPVQVTTAGSNGTGLPTFDYLFSDPVACPQPVRHLFAEKVFDLPCIMTIEALPFSLSPSNPPVLTKGYVTFGVFNRASKISDDVVALWAAILRSVPRSQLLMKHYAFDEASMRSRQLERFAMQGIAAERIVLLGGTSREDHLAAFKDVDISLDTFPHNGGISTLESLQMGVPVVALLGNSISSRAAGAILTSIGMADWMADSADQYLSIAVKFAALPDRLKALRDELPANVAASAVGNGAIYTEAIEAAYRTMWADYCRTAR